MRTEAVRFFSERFLLNGDLYLPDEHAGKPRPAIVACSGYQGLKNIHPARFARALAGVGYVCLGFDYRGFGQNEGERGRLVPRDQIEDVRAAVSYLSTLSDVDSTAISLLGWGLGGGVAIAEAADDPWVHKVVSINGLASGARVTRSMHSAAFWRELLERVDADRHARALGERSQMVHPFDAVRLDSATQQYVDAELYRYAGFGTSVTLESIDNLLRFRPENVVDRIAPRPLLLVHGLENRLHPAEESRELYRRAGEGKEIVLVENTGHTEWMFDDHPTFQRVMDTVRGFLTGDSAPPDALTDQAASSS